MLSVLIVLLILQLRSSATRIANVPPNNALPNRLDNLDDSFCAVIKQNPRPWNNSCHRSRRFSCENANDTLSNQTLMFSFHSQDYYLYTTHFINLKRSGVYWDVAANEPISFSNTFFFDRCLSWRGVCVEANPRYFEELHRERSCHLVPTCASDQNRRVKFRLFYQSGGIKDEEHKHNKIYELGKRTEPPTVDMQCTTMQTVQRRLHGERGESSDKIVVDYFSLDVEGHEMAVLKGIDWSSVKINVITVEIRRESAAQIDQFLKSKGYVQHTPQLNELSKKTSRLSDDVIYVRKDVKWGFPE